MYGWVKKIYKDFHIKLNNPPKTIFQSSLSNEDIFKLLI